LVIENDSDLDEVESLLQELDWPRARTLLMPQARSRDDLSRRAPLLKLAAARGFRLSPRLHIERWNGERGR
jgi:hypothetical protein